MEATEAFKTPHLHPNLEFFKAYGAFSIVDAVLLCSPIRENAGSPMWTG
jgi:hypothetical protein